MVWGMLVSTRWLAAHLDDPDLVVVDLRWGSDGSGRARYDAGHIPGAVFMDWTTDIVDPQSAIAFMLAGPGRVASALERGGVGDDTKGHAHAHHHRSRGLRGGVGLRGVGNREGG